MKKAKQVYLAFNEDACNRIIKVLLQVTAAMFIINAII